MKCKQKELNCQNAIPPTPYLRKHEQRRATYINIYHEYFIDEAILVIKLEANLLNNSPNGGIFKTANISLALVCVDKDNSQRKLLL